MIMYSAYCHNEYEVYVGILPTDHMHFRRYPVNYLLRSLRGFDSTVRHSEL